jgi:hypothetical protein
MVLNSQRRPSLKQLWSVDIVYIQVLERLSYSKVRRQLSSLEISLYMLSKLLSNLQKRMSK